MPNDCNNKLTIVTHNTTNDGIEELNNLIKNEINNIPNIEIRVRGEKGIICSFDTAWTPDFEWLEMINDKYKLCWIKNEWIVEDGTAGIWIGRFEDNDKKISMFEWFDLSIEAEHYYFQPVKQ
jgi:hypothetical protein